MSSTRTLLAALTWVALMFPAPVVAQSNNLWVMWETVPSEAGLPSDYRSHLMFNVPQAEAEDFFYSLIPSARRYGTANIEHQSSPFCKPKAEKPLPQMSFIDDRDREPLEKKETLRGLDGVFADLRGVRGPPGYQSNFGEDAQALLQKAFAEAGIPILSREQMEEAPGRPTLTMRYSPEVSGCRPWSVSLSLKQNVVLTRDTSVMVNAVTWNSSARQSEEDVGYGAYDAVEDAIKVFVADYLSVNRPDGPRPVASN